MTVTTTPAAGLYRLNNQTWEIRISERGNWYAMRQLADWTWQYCAQDINPAAAGAAGPLGPGDLAAQPAECATSGCQLPVWSRGVCGMCLARLAVERASRITIRWGENSK
jgi:hypothetical protein